MAKKRDLSLSPRKENQREATPIEPPIQFSLDEITQHFSESMAALKDQYVVAESLENKDEIVGCKIIWRSQMVLAEGLLDFFIHEMSKYCLFRMFTGRWEKTDKYDSIMVPMGKVEEAIAASQSKDWFFEYLNERFSRDVFLSHESMRQQLNLIGIGYSAVMERAFPTGSQEESVKKGTEIVKNLFARRNAIAHQNDRSHASAVQQDICKNDVEEYISQIEAIVNAIHQIALEKG